MCRSEAEGGRRCPGGHPRSQADRVASGARQRENVRRRVKRRKARDKGPKDVECCDCSTRGWTETTTEDDIVVLAVCDRCGGSGYLTDAAGRIRAD